MNPLLLELDPGVRDAYAAMLTSMADSELVIGHRHSEWTGFAPSAEEDVAFSSIAQDEMGHAHLYYAIIAGADDEAAVDRLALDRGPRALRHLPVLHSPNGDWYFTTARHLYWDVFEAAFLGYAIQSDLPLVAGAAQRVLNEEQYHLDHADEWLGLMSSRVAQRRRLARALARVAGIGGNPAGSVPGLDALGRTGRLAPQDDIARATAGLLLGRLRDAGWATDEVAAVEAGLSRRDPRPAPPPGLYQLHRDLTGLRRAHAGATW